MDQSVVELPLKDIDITLRRERGGPIEEKISELAASSRERGVLNAVIVMRKPSGDAYYLIAGLHRYLGSEEAGETTIPARVLGQGDKLNRELVMAAVDEDFLRKSSQAVEIAEAIREMKSVEMDREEIERYFKLNKSTVNNLERLLSLPKAVLEIIRNGGISPTHGRSLLGLRKLRRELDWDESELEDRMIELAKDARDNEERFREFHERIQDLKAEIMGTTTALQKERLAGTVKKAEHGFDRVMNILRRLDAASKSGRLVEEVIQEFQKQLLNLKKLLHSERKKADAERANATGTGIESPAEQDAA